MARVVILADDLSGAADCGIAFAAAGRDTAVALDADGAAALAADAVAVDLDTRRLAPAAASSLVADATRRLLTQDCRLLYKKIDSTLRGNVAAEIAAACEAASTVRGSRVLAVLAPAFPGTGRITRDGKVYVRGVVLDETELWRREGRGRPAAMVDLLAASALHAIALPLAQVRQGSATVHAAWREALARGAASVVVCDAETDADLATLAAAGDALGDRLVWAGSGGLAAQLAVSSWLGGVRSRAARPMPSRRRDAPIATIVGSLSSVSREQLAGLRQEPDVHCVEIAPAALLAGDAAPLRALDEAIARKPAVLAISIAGEPALDPTQGPALAAQFARLVAPAAGRFGALAVTGGETARALFGAMGIARLLLHGEIEAGVPLAVAQGPTGAAGVPVVTKAGAFGTPDTLVRCVATLRSLGTTEPGAMA